MRWDLDAAPLEVFKNGSVRSIEENFIKNTRFDQREVVSEEAVSHHDLHDDPYSFTRTTSFAPSRSFLNLAKLVYLRPYVAFLLVEGLLPRSFSV
jgi:hypothetical protein